MINDTYSQAFEQLIHRMEHHAPSFLSLEHHAPLLGAPCSIFSKITWSTMLHHLEHYAPLVGALCSKVGALCSTLITETETDTEIIKNISARKLALGSAGKSASAAACGRGMWLASLQALKKRFLWWFNFLL